MSRDSSSGISGRPIHFVDYEQGLKKAVNRLREALNDSAEQPRFIENLPRQGYRFIARTGVRHGCS